MLNAIWNLFPEVFFYLADFVAIIGIIAALTAILCKEFGKQELFLSLGIVLIYGHPHILYSELISRFALGQWTAAAITFVVWIGSLYIQETSAPKHEAQQN